MFPSILPTELEIPEDFAEIFYSSSSLEAVL